MIKDILVSLRVGEGVDVAADYAVSAAAALDAHLTAVAVSYEIDVPPIYTEAFSTDFLDTQRTEGRHQAKLAVDRFGEAARSMGLSGDVVSIDGTPGGAAEEIGIMARLYDLTIVNQADPARMGAEEVIAEAVLFDSGRAVLLVPLNQQKPFSAKRIMVAWDGGRAAARAISEARPLLAKADFVEAVVVEAGKSKPKQLLGADLARHLMEVKVDVRHMEKRSSERHLERLRDGRTDSLQTSSLHLDMLRDLKRINAHIVSVAHPILDDSGALIESRLRLAEPGA